MDTVRGIFISYRQDDAKTWALMLAQDMVEAFGEENVFFDKDTLHAGNWREQIEQALDRSKVVLVVIGPKWVSIKDESAQRRLDSPTDVLRQEISSALSREDLIVIPVRVDGASFPRAEELPENLQSLTDQQSRELSDNSARRKVHLAQLIGDIERATGLVAAVATGTTARAPGRHRFCFRRARSSLLRSSASSCSWLLTSCSAGRSNLMRSLLSY